MTGTIDCPTCGKSVRLGQVCPACGPAPKPRNDPAPAPRARRVLTTDDYIRKIHFCVKLYGAIGVLWFIATVFAAFGHTLSGR